MPARDTLLTLLPECRCRTNAVSLWKKCRRRIKFRYLLRTCRVYTVQYFSSTACSVDVQGISSPQYSFFLIPEYRTVHCPALVSPVTEWKLVLMPEPVRCQNKGVQSGPGMLRYGTEMPDAGMPMPTPSFVNYHIHSWRKYYILFPRSDSWRALPATERGGTADFSPGHAALPAGGRATFVWGCVRPSWTSRLTEGAARSSLKVRYIHVGEWNKLKIFWLIFSLRL